MLRISSVSTMYVRTVTAKRK